VWRRGEGCGEVAGCAFVAHGRVPVAEGAGDRAFCLPAPPPRAFVWLDAASGDARRGRIGAMASIGGAKVAGCRGCRLW
jgi:hypothetical protein